MQKNMRLIMSDIIQGMKAHPRYEGKAYFDIAVIFTKQIMKFNPKVKL